MFCQYSKSTRNFLRGLQLLSLPMGGLKVKKVENHCSRNQTKLSEQVQHLEFSYQCQIFPAAG